MIIQSLPSPCPQAPATMTLFSISALHVLEFPQNGIIRYVTLGLASYTQHVWGFICLVAQIRILSFSWLNNFSLCGYTFCLSISQFLDIWVVTTFWQTGRVLL